MFTGLCTSEDVFYLVAGLSQTLKIFSASHNAEQQILKHGLVQPVFSSQFAVLWLHKIQTQQ